MLMERTDSVLIKMLAGYAAVAGIIGIIGLMIYFDTFRNIIAGLCAVVFISTFISLVAWWIGDSLLGKNRNDGRGTYG